MNMNFDFDAANKPMEQPIAVIDSDPAQLVSKLDAFRSRISEMHNTAAAHTVTDDQTNEEAVRMINQAGQIIKELDKKHEELKRPYKKITDLLDNARKELKDGLGMIQNILRSKVQPYLQEKERVRLEAERKAREEAARIQRELEASARKVAEEAARIKYEAEKAERERIAAENRKAMDAEQAERERIAAELEEKRLKEESEKKAAEAANEAAALVPEIVSEVPSDIKTVTEAGSADLKLEWTYEILSFNNLPEECFTARAEQVEKAVAPWINAQIKAGIRNIQGVRVFQKSTLKTRVK